VLPLGKRLIFFMTYLRWPREGASNIQGGIRNRSTRQESRAGGSRRASKRGKIITSFAWPCGEAEERDARINRWFLHFCSDSKRTEHVGFFATAATLFGGASGADQATAGEAEGCGASSASQGAITLHDGG
jgi:hypothetical protein